MSLGPLMVDLQGDTLSNGEREQLLSPHVGGVILFSRNFSTVEKLRELIADIHTIRHPKLLVAIDQEGGRVQRLRDGFTQLPAVQLLGEIHKSDSNKAYKLAEVTGWLMAAELRSVGIDFSFAPILDLNRGVSRVIGDRAFHNDPEVVSMLALYYMRGMQHAGMQAVGKHFPGHGAVVEDSHIDLPTDSREFQDIAMEDLVPFQRMIHQGLAGIMSAHVIYEKIDQEVATYSSKWLNGVLRKQLGFEGVIFSDDLSMKAADCNADYLQRAQKALHAGCDMVLICNASEEACGVIEQLGDYNNPASQIRLARMHGGKDPVSYQDLRNSKKWQDAVSKVESYQNSPYGELAL